MTYDTYTLAYYTAIILCVYIYYRSTRVGLKGVRLWQRFNIVMAGCEQARAYVMGCGRKYLSCVTARFVRDDGNIHLFEQIELIL